MKKMKKLLVTVIGIAMLSALSASIASAAPVWCTQATVNRVGVRPDVTASNNVVRLTCDDQSKWPGERQYYLTTDLGDAGLATLLTAKSTNMTVRVKIASPNWYSLVEEVELN